MRLDIRFPVMARARRKGGRGEVRMVATVLHGAEVPEISSRETELAMGTVVQSRNGEMRAMRELCLYGGRLYRLIGTTGRDGAGREIDLLSRAIDPGADYVASTNPGFHSGSMSPLSNPVVGVYRHRADALCMHDSGPRNRMWPKIAWYLGADNAVPTLDEALGQSTWVSTEDLEEGYAMHRAQADRMLFIDGELWYETKPPCICVDTLWRKYKPGLSSVEIGFGYLPDNLDHHVTRLYFPLSAAGEAARVAEELRGRFRMKDTVSYVPEFYAKDDHPAFRVDTSEDMVDRVGRALAECLLAYSILRPDRTADVDADWLGEISDMFHRHNPVTGHREDFAPQLAALVETFLRLSPTKFGYFSNYQNEQLRKVLPMAVEHLDDLPISGVGIGGIAPAG